MTKHKKFPLSPHVAVQVATKKLTEDRLYFPVENRCVSVERGVHLTAGRFSLIEVLCRLCGWLEVRRVAFHRPWLG